MSTINQISPDGGTNLYDIEDTTARTDLENKVDKVEGKGLSTNDYTDTDKDIVDGVPSALSTKASIQYVDEAKVEQTQLLEDTVGWIGKNLAPNKAVSDSNNGVTFTVNTDGTVTANGTSTATTPNTSQLIYEIPLKAGTYIFSGCEGGSNSTYYLLYYNQTALSRIVQINNKESDPITIDSDITLKVFFRVSGGVTVNNVKFYPMVRKSNIADATYEPYHASVADSLEEKADNSVIAPIENGTNASQAWSVGQHFIKDGQFKEVTQPIASGGAINDSNTVNRPIADCLIKQATFSGPTSLNGNIYIINTNIVIIGVKMSTGAYVAKPYNDSNGNWFIHFTEPTAEGNVVADTVVSGTYYYID